MTAHYSPAPVGRFSVFGYTYRIAPGRVTLSRNVWLAVPGAALGAGGVKVVVVASGLVGYTGMLMIVAGLLLALAGLYPPVRVTATAKGLRWGRHWIAAGHVTSVKGETRSIRVKGQLVEFAALVVKCDGAPERELRLQDGSVRNLRVEAVANAMATLFGRPSSRRTAD